MPILEGNLKKLEKNTVVLGKMLKNIDINEKKFKKVGYYD